MPTCPAARTMADDSRLSAAGSSLRGSHFVGWKSQSRSAALAQAEAAAGARPATQVVQRVGGRLDEQHAEVGVCRQQPRDQVLVASPDAVPGFERDDDQVRHSSSR